MDKETISIFEKNEKTPLIKSSKGVNFFHCDNMDFLRICKDEMLFKYFHLAIVDPPYGISVTDMNLGQTKDSKPRDYERGEWDGEVPTQEYWDLLSYVSRNVIVWGGNYFTKEFNFSGRCFYFWDKKARKMDFADGELALTSLDKNARVIERARTQKEDADGQKRHDTQKPVYLYDFLYQDNDMRGKRVLDTHGGSFSHAIAAFRNGVNLTIMDKQRSYVDSGIENFEKNTVVQRLF